MWHAPPPTPSTQPAHSGHFWAGLLAGVAYIAVAFGFEIRSKSPPKIQINAGDFIRNSHIYVLGKHVHHWCICLAILFAIAAVEVHTRSSSKHMATAKGFAVALLLHGLLYDDCFDFS
tara:strand:- start:1113 stop:1466 length:354 start_codon:yes stop_codon:yes gene_type:complete